MSRYSDCDLSELLKKLQNARGQLISDKVEGISWIQAAISEAIIWIQIKEQELYRVTEENEINRMTIESHQEFFSEVFGRTDIVDFCTDSEKERLREAIEKADWKDKEEE